METVVAEAWHGWRHMVGLVTGVTRGRVETWVGLYMDTLSGCAEECGRDSCRNNGHSEVARWSVWNQLIICKLNL